MNNMFLFIINQYITLKLEDKKTDIHINGEKFMQCKKLLLNINQDDIHKYAQLDSIYQSKEINIYQFVLYQFV